MIARRIARVVAFAALASAACGDEGSESPGAPSATTPDSGVTATQDGGGPLPDGASTIDGGTAGCATALSATVDDRVPCGNGTSCGAGDLCCLSAQAACRPKSSDCLAGEKGLSCSSSNGVRCGAGTICCLAATSTALASLKTSTTCPAPLRFADFSNTNCFAACNEKRLPVCQADAECQGGTSCHAVQLVEAAAPITFGVCY